MPERGRLRGRRLPTANVTKLVAGSGSGSGSTRSAASGALAGDASCHGMECRVLVERLLVLMGGRLDVEDHPLDRTRERVRGLVLVGAVDHQAVVPADVHA